MIDWLTVAVIVMAIIAVLLTYFVITDLRKMEKYNDFLFNKIRMGMREDPKLMAIAMKSVEEAKL